MKYYKRLAAEMLLEEWQTNGFNIEKLDIPMFWLIVDPIGTGKLDRLTALVKYKIPEVLYKECIEEYDRWLDGHAQRLQQYNGE